MNLEQLKEEAYKDLPITDQEHLDQESFHNQDIKAKWLDYKSRFELLLVKNKGDYHSYKNAFHEFKPNYLGYDFIIPSKNIEKTIKKMKFSLINNI